MSQTNQRSVIHDVYQYEQKVWKLIGWRCSLCDRLCRTKDALTNHINKCKYINTTKEIIDMPIQAITKNGQRYYRYEDNGKLYETMREAEQARDNGSGYKKKKGADDKACWEGYRYAGTVNGRDKCVKIKKD